MADTEYSRQGEKYMLKPCPFCGKVPSLWANDTEENFFVRCSSCFAQSDEYFTRTDAVDAWNKRASSKEVNAEAWNNALHELVHAVSEISRLVKESE